MSQLKHCALLEQRKKVCHAIASLPENATTENVSKVLGPVIADYQGKVSGQGAAEEAAAKDDGVTPIMLACDKAQLSCLHYIVMRLMDKNDTDADVWGHPFDASSETAGGNSAMHFAAMSGCAESIDSLCSMATMQKCRSSIKALQGEDQAQDNLLFRILSQKNGHGDTPLMMASAGGHIRCLRHWTMCLAKSFSSERNGIQLSRTRELFEQRNESGDTVLSLACGHGHSTVVDLLINDQALFPDESQDGIVDVKYEDVGKCKATLDRIGSLFEQVKWDSLAPSQREEYQTRRENVRRCLVMLQVASAHAARRNMESLLLSEDKNQERLQQQGQNRTKKQKKSRNKRQKKSKALPAKVEKSSISTEDSLSDTSESSEQNEVDSWGHQVAKTRDLKDTVNAKIDGKNAALPGFVTMLDGTATQPGNTQELDRSTCRDCDEAVLSTRSKKAPISVEQMLRERYQNEDMSNHTVDAVMESLCLDASMLLLSSHGMALKLSPSQLDAVSGILKKQMDSVDEARIIQGRLRTKPR